MKKLSRNIKNNTGQFSAFTLIELIIVVSILAVLALIAISYFRGQIFKGNDAKRKGDINRIKIAVEEYEKDHNCYPPPQNVVCSGDGAGLRPYLDKIPCDPTTKASYIYDYQNSVCPSWFRIFANLENKTDQSIIPAIGPNSAFNYVDSSPNAPEVSSSENSSSPTPPPTGGGGGSQDQEGYWGCKNSVCVPIVWDSARPGPECDPSFRNGSCYGVCSVPSNACMSWK